MSAATPEWPAWLRRHSAVELLGPPRTFFAWLSVALSLAAIIYVGSWNAARYPVSLGYDAEPNAAYMHVLLDQHHLPRADQSQEANQPPLYYFLAEVAARAGHETFGWLEARPYTQFPEASYRGAQIFNEVLVFLTALIVLVLARLWAPERPSVWAASVGFFAFLPVVAKTAAMLHAETLSMFLSAVALLLTTLALRHPSPPRRHLAGIAAVLVLVILVRSSALFTVVAITLGVAWTAWSRGWRLRLTRRHLLLAASLIVALVAAWATFNRTPDLGRGLLHPETRTSVATRANFWNLPLIVMFRSPFRPHAVNAALPVTYTEIWGDWIGAFAWSGYSSAPWPPALAILRDQNVIGLLPTLLALVGWAILARTTLRWRREWAPIVLLPPIAIGGYLLRSYQTLSADGDLLKASYLLTTAPVWALGFGAAFGALHRRRMLRTGLAVCLVVFAILELRFLLYGIRDHHPIF